MLGHLRIAAALSTTLVSAGALRAQGGTPSDATPAVISWIRQHAIPISSPDSAKDFRDLQPLKRLIGNARIVALGEGTHGTHEFFAMKRRVVEFLAREMGFTIFAMEGNLPESHVINDYVHTGRGDPAEVVRGLTFWTWTTEELTDLVRWMRSYNAAGGRMDFAGVDIQLPTAAQRNVIALAGRADPALSLAADSVYRWIAPRDRDYVVGVVTLSAAAYAGRRVHFSAWVKSRNVAPSSAGLYLGPDGAAGPLPRTITPTEEGVSGTTEWKRLEVTAEIPKEAVSLRTGFILRGFGTVWIDNARLEVEGEVSAGAQSWTFESGQPEHRLDSRPVSNIEKYELQRDSTGGYGGSAGLRIVSRDAALGPPPTPARAFAAAAGIAARIDSAAGTLLRALPADTVAWLRANARMVAQSFEWRADSTQLSREVSMARNIQWLLDRAPAGTRIVVWAHNGHVSRDPSALGARLAELYPGQMVNVGFTTSEGSYNAEAPGSIQEFPLREPPAGSVESALRLAGPANFLLDLRAARTTDPASRWLTEERPFRFIGIEGTDTQFWPRRVTAEYDLLVYFGRTRASTLLPRSS